MNKPWKWRCYWRGSWPSIAGDWVILLRIGSPFMVVLSVAAAASEPFPSVLPFAFGRDGQMASSDGLVIRSWGTEAGLPQNTVNAITQTRDGYLWLGTRDGLARFDGVRFTVFGLREGLPSIEVQALFEDRQGQLWIGTGGGGLSRLFQGRIQTVTGPERGLVGDIVSALAEDGQGRLWIGSRGGLSLWQDGNFTQADPALAELNRAAIAALVRDRQGGMWIATARQGLFEFRNQRLRESRGPPGHERISAYCLLEDDAGNLWASIGNGVILCRRGAVWGQYDQADGVPYAYVTSLAQEADGTIWAGSLDDGLYRFANGRFIGLRHEQGLSANDIRCLRPDREGNLWVGTRTGGLDRLSRIKIVHWGTKQGLSMILRARSRNPPMARFG